LHTVLHIRHIVTQATASTLLKLLQVRTSDTIVRNYNRDFVELIFLAYFFNGGRAVAERAAAAEAACSAREERLKAEISRLVLCSLSSESQHLEGMIFKSWAEQVNCAEFWRKDRVNILQNTGHIVAVVKRFQKRLER